MTFRRVARDAGEWLLVGAWHVGMCVIERVFGPTLHSDKPSHVSDWHAQAEREIEREASEPWP